MKKSARITGKLAFWLSWPVLFLYFLGSKRTRVVLHHEDKILLVTAWYGAGQWILPGGGLHKGEDPVQGAVREVKEETSIEIHATKLQKITEMNVRNGQGFRFKVYAFSYELAARPTVSRQKHEIADSTWMSWQDALQDPKVSHTTKRVLRALYGTGDLL